MVGMLITRQKERGQQRKTGVEMIKNWHLDKKMPRLSI
jgi:hypothetical protein